MGWTIEQEKAIKTRDRTLLVSAAAGSGKTATLTERIIQSILDDKNPSDISRMLIATYTNAAVDELKDRIGGAIKEAVKKNPTNPRLEEQLLHLKDAKILTITSFCNEILRASAESIGLPPNYRIAEPPEAKILSSSVLEALINAAYEGELTDVCTADEFIALADSLSNVKYSEGLSKTITYIFEKLTYSEHEIDTLLPFINEYNPDDFISVEQTRYGEHIISLTNYIFSEYSEAYNKVIRLASCEHVDEKNLPKAEAELETVRKCATCKSYSSLRESITSYSLKKPHRTGKEPITDFYQNWRVLRSYAIDDLKKIGEAFFSYSAEEWRDLYTELYKSLTVLYKFLKKYYTVFADEKRRRGICEFSDVERYAYEALYNKDGSITPLAKELSEKFDAVYVDEYQDVNGLQSKIFSAISKENNRFMVGDIKQSIYCFRSARPEIFAEMKDRFPILGSDGDYPYASIFMSNNFRCDRTVVDFVNGIFDRMFGLVGESIGYKPEDRLVFSKEYRDGAAPTGKIPEIHIVEKPHAQPSDTEGFEEGDEAEAAIIDDMNASRAQARAISKKISELIGNVHLANGKLIEPKDIAILMNSVKGTLAAAIGEELSLHGIPSSVTEVGDLFMCEDVLLALSFISSVDNPRKDVYLSAIMLSPIFGFDADAIYKIRSSYDHESLWECTLSYFGDHPEDERCRHFITSLLRYRKLAEGMPTDALISMIYRESGLLALAAKNGGKDNLILLHSYARKYEQSDFKGIYSFINYIGNLIEKDETFPAAASADDGNAVKIMTIHKSKGLEFPVTFIAGAESAPSGGDDNRIIFSDNFGISMKTKDKSGLALVDNPTFNAIKRYVARSEFDEDLRVLYVALTRAREMLYVYGSCTQKDTDEYLASVDTMRYLLSPYLATKARNFLDVVMFSRAGGQLFIDSPSIEAEDSKEPKKRQSEEKADAMPSDGEEVYNILKERFEFVNPNAHLEVFPEKISVSKLTPSVLDGTEESEYTLEDLLADEGILPFDEAGDDEIPQSSEQERAKPRRLPSFITGISERESAKRGIATHTVMQFCDFELLEKTGVEQELARLCRLEFLSEEDAKRVRISELYRFVESPLFKEMKSAKKLYRELRFNVKLPAHKFTQIEDKKLLLDGSEVLVQGVIDCIIEHDDGSLHLIDYKTDRLTKEERETVTLGEERLRKAHALQLSYYCDAIKQMFGKAPERVGIYSLHLGKEVELFI